MLVRLCPYWFGLRPPVRPFLRAVPTHAPSASYAHLLWLLQAALLYRARLVPDGIVGGWHTVPWSWRASPSVPNTAVSTPRARHRTPRTSWVLTLHSSTGNPGSCAAPRRNHMLLLSCTGFLCGHTSDS